jgi:hypothetical protein
MKIHFMDHQNSSGVNTSVASAGPGIQRKPTRTQEVQESTLLMKHGDQFCNLQILTL